MDIFEDLPEVEPSIQSDEDVKERQNVVIPKAKGSNLFCDIPPCRKEERGEKRHSTNMPDQPNTSRRKLSVRYQILAAVAEQKGERDDMQDSHCVLDHLIDLDTNLDPTISRVSLYAVFDGHAGSRASRFAQQNLPRHLRDKFPKGDVSVVEKELKKAIIESFRKIDDDFLKEARKSKPAWKDGSTACIVLILNDTMYIANLGDSKAVLCRYKPDEDKRVSIPLTTDHSPSLYDERLRIQKAGGHIKDGRVMGILEVSRSLGDGQYKNHGVTCIPDVKRCQLTEQDCFVILACDGLWKSFTIEESMEFVQNILQDEAITGTDEKSTKEVRLETACNKLASEAVRRLSADNVTVLIISMDNPLIS